MNGSLVLGTIEARHLHETKILLLTAKNGTPLSSEQILALGRRTDKRFVLRSTVYSDLRNRGYTVKTGLKFGAEFVVYDRGAKPGADHSRWSVFPVGEREHATWHDLAAKNRVAHTAHKRLLLAVVDDEDDVTYFELRWTRP
jgi:tRNA-intron endonuclease